ncbi:endonuclease/exonuclease/phosphatase family protein [Actinomadura hibisca]|uniref:endonuclease/exonuclease/phosphatase family protein n=1 Tax=Actinomadura hibisca TaxID=68565 RepID=UPI000A87F173|nr:endonuclease/exonuclease/phosphatase family protein [Actinomadura hibisca]
MTLQTRPLSRGDQPPDRPSARPGRRGAIIAAAAVVLAALLAGHRLVPGNAGTLLDTALPWVGLLIPLLLLAAALRRARLGLVATALPAVVWLALFGTAFLPGGGGSYDVRAVSQNMYADNPSPAATAAALVGTKADLLALQEMPSGDHPARLSRVYPHHVVKGTVGLWSRWPLRGAKVVPLGLGWPRALRATVATPKGDLAVYVAHLGSARPGRTGGRDATMDRLAAVVRADRARRVLVLGDLNTATTDRKLGALVPPLRESQRSAGTGLGFTWPSRFPVARPDHILFRGVDAVGAGTVPTPGSDHHAVRADFTL